MRRLDERRAWRERQWARRNRSAHWLIQQATHQAETTHRFVKPIRIARCGWPIGHPVIQILDHTASIRNLEHCASPWACPVCATIIRATRARDLQQAADTWTSQGHGLLFATLTRPHIKTEPLETGIDTTTQAWTDLTASQRWRRIRHDHHIRHWARALETTWNPHTGWHVHIHALLFTDTPHPDAASLQASLWTLWNHNTGRHGSRTVSKKHGVLVLPVDDTPGKVGDYMSKPPDRIGSELTRMDTKQGRKHSLAPFQLLDDDIPLDPDQARRLWLEYVHATRGQRSITWSRRLRAELLHTPEQTDQQIIDHTHTGTDAIDLDPDDYRKLKQNPNILSHILALTETGQTPLAQDIINDV